MNLEPQRELKVLCIYKLNYLFHKLTILLPEIENCVKLYNSLF